MGPFGFVFFPPWKSIQVDAFIKFILLVTECYSMVWTYCSLLNHLSAWLRKAGLFLVFVYYRYKCYEHFVQVFVWSEFSFLCDKCQGVWWLGYLLFSYLTSWKTANTSSRVPASFYFPPAGEEWFVGFHILSSICWHPCFILTILVGM